MSDEHTVSVFTIRETALSMAIECRDGDEADTETVKRAGVFYDYLIEGSVKPATPRTDATPNVLPLKPRGKR